MAHLPALEKAAGVDLGRLVDRTGLTLQVGAMKRHDPGVGYARRFVAGWVGEVRSFSAWYRIGDLRPGIEATLFPPVAAEAGTGEREAAFKADRRRYLLATHGAHVFDTVRCLVGEVASLVARHRQDGPDHLWQVLAVTATGAVGTITIAPTSPASRPRTSRSSAPPARSGSTSTSRSTAGPPPSAPTPTARSWSRH